MSHLESPRLAADRPSTPEAARRVPKRDEIGPCTLGFLRPRRDDKPDVRVVDVGDGPVVVKDFADKPWLTRLRGRLDTAHEYRAYRMLGPTPNIPALVGRIDAHAIAIEFIAAEQLVFSPRRLHQGERILADLAQVIQRFEAAGIFQMDLRSRRNLLLDAQGKLIVLDLGASVCLPPGSLRYRCLAPLFAAIHRSAFLKWKTILRSGQYTSDETAFLRLHRWLRRIWLLRKPGKYWSND